MGKEKLCGIYCIKNLINDKKYVGQSTDLKRRKIQHRSSSSMRRNTFLYNAIKKYGINNFEFCIIENCKKQDLDEREKYWISFFDTFNYGYNMTTGGMGVPSLITQRNVIPKNFKEFSNLDINSTVPIIELNMDYKIINEWVSVQDCARDTGICATNIAKCAKLKHLTSNKRIFMYKDEIKDLNSDEILTLRFKKRNSLNFNKSYSTAKRKVNLLDKNGTIIYVYDSVSIAARDLNVDISAVVKVCKGRLKQTSGYYFNYA